MNEAEYRKRCSEIPYPIIEIARDNILINSILQQYAHGQIITLTECLCRMVVELSKDWERERKEYEELLKLSVIPSQPFHA